MNVEFKIANETNVEEIIKVCNICFDETTDVNQAKQIFETQQNDKNQIYLIGIVDNKIVAHTKITIIPTIFDSMDTYAVLNHVCVLKEYRNQKIATKMLETVEKICKERGCTSMKLWSKNFRQAAHACYKKFGFEVIDAAFFEKEL